MKATDAKLINLLGGRGQFVVPIYQRNYSWKKKQCNRLFEDILRVGGDKKISSYFAGSVVYFEPDDLPETSVPQLLVIDGQQRITTISLMLLALVRFLQKNPQHNLDDSGEEILQTYLINAHKKDETRFKLLLSKKDKNTFINLVDEIETTDASSQRIDENYQLIKEKLTAENIQAVYHGIKKLAIVDMKLERGKDDPQLIFESLNSTGLGLSQADLIRNYMLMNEPVDTQNHLYEKYWYPMEQDFVENMDYLPQFIRHYLSVKQSTIPNINLVYEAYKDFDKDRANNNLTKEYALKELRRYAQFYARMAFHKEPDKALAKGFDELNKLKMDVVYPFLLAVYHDYEEKIISKNEFIEVVRLVVSYLLCRAVCDVPTNMLNKTFSILHKKINQEAYLESLKAAFILMKANQRFPKDKEFKEALKKRDCYNFRPRNYLLRSLENWGRKEPVCVENFTIEHILPQNEELPQAWRDVLGENWQEVRETYLHTLGNLTLTGYNSELSDKAFTQKKTTNGGFNDSPLFLNESVRNAQTWDENAIIKRAELLAQRACEIWQAPDLSDAQLASYKQTDKEKYSLDSYEYLHGDMRDLFNRLEKRICNLDSEIEMKCTKLYAAFKINQANVIEVVPLKRGLRIYLGIDFEKINDPQKICRDVSDIGSWGTGNVEVRLERADGLDYVMMLVEQALDEQRGED